MDDAVPRLIGLLLAGGVALMSLRGHLPDTPRGQAIFRLTLVAFLVVIALAAVSLLRRAPPITPDPEAPTTIAGLRRPVAPAGTTPAYVDNIAAGSHNPPQSPAGAAAKA